MSVNKIFNEKALKVTLIILIAFIVALLIFKLGILVGSKKALFSCRWAERYAPNFFGPRPDMPRRFFEEFDERNLMRAYGTLGKIIQINTEEKSIVVKNEQEPEKIALISSDTIIERGRTKILFSDLKVDDFVAIIGAPNNEGKIQARIIRVLPGGHLPSPQSLLIPDGRKNI